MGDPAGGYKESPTGVALGGAFTLARDGEEDWCYYLGKYEVTEAQFAAIMGEAAPSEATSYPVRNLSWFRAGDFIRKYNQWLYENSQQDMPEYGGVPGYIRLPTEFEWEFAARGGSAVDGAAFDRKLPFPSKDITRYEWFSGPKSSHNKIKKVGLLKANPLGLHDMLGNVAEMTRTLYHVEYYQGRSGGFVAKGGHFLTSGKQLRSSLRTEQEFYSLDRKTKQFAPAGKTTLGFRLMLSSLVFPNRQVSRQLKDDWEEYRQGTAKSLPAAVSVASTSAKTEVSGIDAQQYLERLKKELSASGAMSDGVRQEVEHLAASLAEIQFTITQAEQDSAYAWIKIAGEQAFFIVKDARKLPILQKMQESAKKTNRQDRLKKLDAREAEIRHNIEQAMSSYTESVRQLGTTGASAVDGGFERYQKFLTERKAEQQILLLPTVRRHGDLYLKNQRTDDEQWKEELLNWKE